MAEPHASTTHCPIPNLGPDTYTRWRQTELGRITEELQLGLMLRLIGDVSGKRVLDVGCGDGKLAVELARRGAAVVGVDASESMIDAARRRVADSGVGVALELATADALPFPDGSFDVVAAITILCFVENAAPAFAEIARVLQPGGRLVIGELNKWSTWAASRRLRAWLGSALWRRGRFRTPNELRQLALNAGLAPGPVTGAIYYPRSASAARLMRGIDPRLGRLTSLGAAFLAFSAAKPAARST